MTLTLGLFLFLSTNLIAVPVFAEFYDARRVLQGGLLLGIGAIIVASSGLRNRVLALLKGVSTTAKVGVGGVLVAGVVSALLAPIPYAGLREITLLTLTLGLALSLAAARDELGEVFDVAVLASIVGAVFTYAVVFVVLRRAHISLFGFESISFRPWNFFYGWSNARFFGQFAAWSVPLLAAAPIVLRDRTLATRALCWISAVGLWALTIEAGGRGSIVFVVAAVPLTLVVLGPAAKRWARNSGIVLLGGAALWYAGTTLMHLLYAPASAGGASPGVARAVAKGGSDNWRFVFWEEAAEMIAARPLLGVGPEHYSYYQQALRAAHPHNAPLQIASEWGVPAAIILGGLVAWGLWAWIRSWRTRGDLAAGQAGIVAALTGSVLAAGMLSMVDGVLVGPASQVMLALVVGWMVALYLRGRDEQLPVEPAGLGSPTFPWTTHITLTVVALGLTATLVWTAGPYLWSPQETMLEQVERHQIEHITPRFWVQGQLFED